MKTYTADEWIAGAIFEGGVYWREADGEGVEIHVPAGAGHRSYGLRGPRIGSISVVGDGSGNAWRGGAGRGNARRDGNGDGVACRGGAGSGDAWRGGAGSGDAWRGGAGRGNARRDGAGRGDACRGGNGDGDAWRGGAGRGGAWRGGAGRGNARRDGNGDGDAWRGGAGRGNARRGGAGRGNARRDGDGDGAELDGRGHRARIPSPDGISYACAYGDGHLRIGCEIHALAEWIEQAEEIDDDHGDGIAHLTMALAKRLLNERNNAPLNDRGRVAPPDRGVASFEL